MRNSIPDRLPAAAFTADWTDVLFLHFRVEAGALRCVVPAELEIDLFDASGYVSLVAFTQRRLRPVRGGRLAALLTSPLAEHAFLNLRTYVRRGDQPGIFFIAEWIPNRLAAVVGPRTYGLPYRVGALRYRFDAARGRFAARVASRDGRLLASARFDPRLPALALRGSLDDFLVERYVAFTHRRGVLRRFEVAHEPWPQTRALVEVEDMSVLTNNLPLGSRPQFVTAHVSPGVFDVTIGAPARSAAGFRQ